MEYNNLDILLKRVNEFNRIGGEIAYAEQIFAASLENEILTDDRLIKIFKIIKILKTAHPADLNFDEIKNFDANFNCDGDKIIIKFSDSLIEYRLMWNGRDERLTGEAFGLDDRYTLEFFKFFIKTRDNIEKFANKFIDKINKIMLDQDGKYKHLYKNSCRILPKD